MVLAITYLRAEEKIGSYIRRQMFLFEDFFEEPFDVGHFERFVKKAVG